MRPRLLLGVEVVTLSMGVTTVGRDQSCGITFADPSLSRTPACFDVRADGVVLRDLGSRNGTRANGVRIDGPATLASNDRIRIGPREIVFTDGVLEPSSSRDRVRTGRMTACAACGEPLAAEVPACPDCGTAVEGGERA